MMLTFVLCQFISHCRYSEIRTRLYTLSSEAKAAHSSPPEPNITPQFDLPSQAKVINPDKISISI